jgi:hypothetical protein
VGEYLARSNLDHRCYLPVPVLERFMIVLLLPYVKAQLNNNVFIGTSSPIFI